MIEWNTDETVNLWIGVNAGLITVGEYYEMLNLLK